MLLTNGHERCDRDTEDEAEHSGTWVQTSREILVIDDDGTETPTTEDGVRATKGSERVLIGHFAADADVDALVDAILETVPADERPPEDRPERLPKPI